LQKVQKIEDRIQVLSLRIAHVGQVLNETNKGVMKKLQKLTE